MSVYIFHLHQTLANLVIKELFCHKETRQQIFSGELAMMCGKLVGGEPAARQCLGLGPSSALKVSTKVFFSSQGQGRIISLNIL